MLYYILNNCPYAANIFLLFQQIQKVGTWIRHTITPQATDIKANGYLLTEGASVSLSSGWCWTVTNLDSYCPCECEGMWTEDDSQQLEMWAQGPQFLSVGVRGGGTVIKYHTVGSKMCTYWMSWHVSGMWREIGMMVLVRSIGPIGRESGHHRRVVRLWCCGGSAWWGLWGCGHWARLARLSSRLLVLLLLLGLVRWQVWPRL